VKRFKQLNIRAKLILIILAVSFIIVTLIGGVRLAWDMQQGREALVQELSAATRLLSSRSRAALAFDDSRLGRENLAALQELPHVIRACLYRSDFTLLAQYQRKETTNNHCPATTRKADMHTHFDTNSLHVVAAVQHGNQSTGWVYLSSDLSPLETRLRNQLAFSTLALLAAFLFAGLLAAWLQRLISEPIKAITNIAQQIEEQGNHQLRAPVTSDDEIGRLARSFNAMLDALQTQNRQLIATRSEQQTTSALYRSLVESTSAIPWVMDLASWCFTYVGHQAETILGYPITDWYEENFWVEHLHPDDRDSNVAFYQSAITKVQNHQFEYRMLAADGHVVWIHDEVHVISEAGKPVLLQGFMLDITERVALDETLRRSQSASCPAALPMTSTTSSG